MPKEKHTKAKPQRKDSAVKNTLNPPDETRVPRRSPEPGPSGAEERQIKRQFGQFSGPGQPPLMKK